MNRSGMSIRAAAEYLRLAPGQVLVAHDDLDLPPGVVRLKSGGGAGGHNGLRDTITQVGEAFWRLRVGIGHPGDRSRVLDYVLNCAPREEEAQILQAVGSAVDIMPMLLQHGPEKVMNVLHRNTLPSPRPGGEGQGEGS
jgi:PTH1 family peptidyl-tRNA hydrolase